MHPLTAYRASQGLTMEAFAALIGATKGAVSKWEQRLAEPRATYRQKIFEVTDGKVIPADLVMPATEAVR